MAEPQRVGEVLGIEPGRIESIEAGQKPWRWFPPELFDLAEGPGDVAAVLHALRWLWLPIDFETRSEFARWVTFISSDEPMVIPASRSLRQELTERLVTRRRARAEHHFTEIQSAGGVKAYMAANFPKLLRYRARLTEGALAAIDKGQLWQANQRAIQCAACSLDSGRAPCAEDTDHGVLYGVREDGCFAQKPCEVWDDFAVQARLTEAGIPKRFARARLSRLRESATREAGEHPGSADAQLYLEAVRRCCAFAALGGRVSPPGLTLGGQVGSGKSTLACALARDLLENGHAVRFVSVPDLLDEIKAQWRKRSAEQRDVLGSYRRVGVLVLDDLGTEYHRPGEGVESPESWAAAELFKLLNARYAAEACTIVTTNLTPAEFPAVLGERIADRLGELTDYLPVPSAQSRRRQWGEGQEGESNG